MNMMDKIIRISALSFLFIAILMLIDVTTYVNGKDVPVGEEQVKIDSSGSISASSSTGEKVQVGPSGIEITGSDGNVSGAGSNAGMSFVLSICIAIAFLLIK